MLARTAALRLFGCAGTREELARPQPDAARFVAQLLQQGRAIGGQDLPLSVEHQQTCVNRLEQRAHDGAVADRPHLGLQLGGAGAFVGHHRNRCHWRAFNFGLRHWQVASLRLG